MVPEHIAKLFEQGAVMTEDNIKEIKDLLRRTKPLLVPLLSDKVIQNYNNGTVDDRIRMGKMVLKYFG